MIVLIVVVLKLNFFEPLWPTNILTHIKLSCLIYECLLPDALAIRAGELPIPAPSQLEDSGVWFSIFAALHVVSSNDPLMLPKDK